ncbi:unnamed protein product [Lactuca virosa]|uniref:PPPDE domain-containing protein n=1 Tax=Lactuca virosa TaxID=75947 RepID=A0AAU9NDR4_9ASTR|nr:unnamed protein product [Lactuca virosa]
MYLDEILPRYTQETYSLLSRNCKNFSSEVAQFLVGVSIPDYILNLPNEVMSSPMGALICKFLILFIFLTFHVKDAFELLWILILHMTFCMNHNAYDTEFGDHIEGETSSQKNVNVAPPPPPPVVVPVGTSQEKPVIVDPLGDARIKVQEEIGKEFAAMMSSWTLRASEAAALVTKKVMQKYGHMNAAQN